MAKKKIQKAPKSNKKKEEESHQEEEEVLDEQPKEVKTPAKSVQNTSLFTQSFTNKIEQFKSFYTDYIKMKGSDDEDQYEKVIKAVAQDMQKTCSKVLQHDLSDAGNWIKEKISEIQKQIKSTSEAVENTRKALQTAGTFSEPEIEAQLDLIRQKGKRLQETLEEFRGFQQRAAQISGENNQMEEE